MKTVNIYEIPKRQEQNQQMLINIYANHIYSILVHIRE